MKKTLSAFLFLIFAFAPHVAAAQQTALAIVVQSCGTAPYTYVKGQRQPVVQDANGNVCTTAAGGGGGNIGSDGSGTIAAGGTAQDLFGGATPTNGFGIYNPDPLNDLWVSFSTVALANGQGSIRVAANGGGYETPPNMKPFHAISVVGAGTGQVFTAIKW